MTDEIVYLTVEEAIITHIMLMRWWDETYFGVDRRDLLESALARPQQSANYEPADILRQAASLCFGLGKNHPWLGGNKRSATYIMEVFLDTNGFSVNVENSDIVRLALRIESDEWKVDEIDAWLRENAIRF